MGIFYAILILGILIAFHEFGHFIFAKLFGVGVRVFSIGFGPKLLMKKIGETEYALSLLPLGGYVKMVGEEDEEAQDSEWVERPEKSFRSKHVFKGILIVIAGPFFNLLLGFILLTTVFAFYGVPVFTNRVGMVTKNSPAEKAGMMAGDKVVKIDGAPVSTWEDIVGIVSKYKADRPMEILLERGGNSLSVKVYPELIEEKNVFGEPITRYIFGISPAPPFMKRDAQTVFIAGAQSTYNLTALTVLSIWKLVSGSISSDGVGGPILITQIAGQAASMGLEALLRFMAVLSISLFVMNVLPIPALDGGHLFFFCLEWIRGKPLSKKAENTVQAIGVTALVSLMLFATYNDILRFFK